MWRQGKRAELVSLLGNLAFYNDKGIDYARHDAARVAVEREKGMTRVRELLAAIGPQHLPREFVDAVTSGAVATDASGHFASLLESHFG